MELGLDDDDVDIVPVSTMVSRAMILITNAYARACVASVVERPWTPPVEPRRLDPAPCFRLPTQRVVILLYILIAMNVLTQFGCEQVQLSQSTHLLEKLCGVMMEASPAAAGTATPVAAAAASAAPVVGPR